MSGLARRAAAVAAVLVEPAPLILAGATVAHIARRNVVDIAVFVGTLILILTDRAISEPPADAVARRLPHVPLPVAALLVSAFAVAVGSRPIGTPVMAVMVAGPGLAALVAVVVATPADPAPTRSRHDGPAGGWPWALVLVLAALVELADFLTQPDPDTDNPAHPTLSSLIGPLLETAAVRVVVAAVWVAGLWWLVGVCVRLHRGEGRT